MLPDAITYDAAISACEKPEQQALGPWAASYGLVESWLSEALQKSEVMNEFEAVSSCDCEPSDCPAIFLVTLACNG